MTTAEAVLSGWILLVTLVLAVVWMAQPHRGRRRANASHASPDVDS